MDYEELYRQMQILEKDLKDKITALQKAFKSLTGNSEKGEIKAVSKDLAQIGAGVEAYERITGEYSALVDNFSAKDYMEQGFFAKQMIDCCESLSVDIKGDFPVYEVFPHKLRIESENQDIYIDKKRTQGIRPLYLVKSIKQNLDRLNRAPFNAVSFLNELAAAYDTASAEKGKADKNTKNERDMLLKDLYPYLVPMQRFRKEYDMQSYAFDLARLHNSDVDKARDGRGYDFGTTRNVKSMIRILDKDGKEQFLSSIRFFEINEEA